MQLRCLNNIMSEIEMDVAIAELRTLSRLFFMFQVSANACGRSRSAVRQHHELKIAVRLAAKVFLESAVARSCSP